MDFPPEPAGPALDGEPDEGFVALTVDDQRQRLRTQVEIILDALGRDVVRVEPGTGSADLADFRYLHRLGTLLVRDEDLERVRELVGGEATQVIEGLTSLRLGTDVAAALDLVDATLGDGIAMPDHVVHVTPASCCPATEPEEVPAGSRPVPEVSTDTGCSGAGVRVSVVDSGLVERTNRTTAIAPWTDGVVGDLEQVVDGEIHAYGGHGTFVAGVVRCMAPLASVTVEGFLTHGGAVFESEIVRQLDESLVREPHVISLSAGTRSRKHLPLVGFEAFGRKLARVLPDSVLVAAAGNDHSSREFWPAAFPWAIGVGGLDRAGERARWSNHGDWVDVFALGARRVNAFAAGTYVCTEPAHLGEVRTFDGMCRWSGTSFAAPLVAGLVAARMSATGETARAAAEALLELARTNPGPDTPARLEPGMGCPGHVG